jgi:hypothetical protein
LEYPTSKEKEKGTVWKQLLLHISCFFNTDGIILYRHPLRILTITS